MMSEWKMEQIERYINMVPKEKYDTSGIYCIKANDKIVYVGKSSNMRHRIASHCFDIDFAYDGKKYKVLNEMKNSGVRIGFDVLSYCDIDKLTEIEGLFIRSILPILNTQIPKPEGG